MGIQVDSSCLGPQGCHAPCITNCTHANLERVAAGVPRVKNAAVCEPCLEKAGGECAAGLVCVGGKQAVVMNRPSAGHEERMVAAAAPMASAIREV